MKLKKLAGSFEVSGGLLKLREIFFLGIFSSVLGYFFLDHFFALGVLVGMPIGMFNYCLVVSAVEGLKGESPQKSQNRFMIRALMRMLISIFALIIATRWGTFFMLGVAAGLILQTATYFKDAVKLLFGKG